MIKIPVYLRDMCDAKHLVQAASGCEKNVDLICGRYIVDAKSILGYSAFLHLMMWKSEQKKRTKRNSGKHWKV